MKHRQKISGILLGLFVVSAVTLSGCDSIKSIGNPPEPTPVVTQAQSTNSVISEGNLVPNKYLYLAFPAGGHVAEVLVEKGDQVAQGDVLARLGDREQVEASVTASQLELEAATQALDDLNKNADVVGAQLWQNLINANQQVNIAQVAWNKVDTDEYQTKIDDAEVKVSDAAQDLEDAQKDFDKYKNLAEDNSLRKSYKKILDDAQSRYDQAVLERDTLLNDKEMAKSDLELAKASQVIAQSDFDATRSGPDPDQLRLAEARLENARAQLNASQAALENMEIRAPFNGMIVDTNVEPNELVSPEKWAFLLADFSQWVVETNDLTELEVVKVALGQEVILKPDALPDMSLSGEVTEISDMFTTQSGDILYKVTVQVKDIDPRLRWGMTIEVEFID